ncbi:aspartate carbamoyltransferase, partial [Klebsiella pneumoniae]
MDHMSIVKIENVRVLDPIQKTDSVQTVYLQDGKLIAPVDQVEQTIDG